MTKIKKAIELISSAEIPSEAHNQIIEIIKNLLKSDKYYDDQNFWQLFNQASQGEVRRHVLYHDPKDQKKNVLVVLKYTDAVVNYHYHDGEEIILVLDGYQESFDHKKYDVIQPELAAKIKNDLFHYDFSDGIITNKAGTGHGVKSKHCLVLIFYKKLPQFPNKNS
jgi:hypothetical protein